MKPCELVLGRGRSHERVPLGDAVVLVDVNVVAEPHRDLAVLLVLVDVADAQLCHVAKPANAPLAWASDHQLTIPSTSPRVSRSSARMSARISSSVRSGCGL